MKALKFIDRPQDRSLDQYSIAVEQMTERLKMYENVVSIYQIGSVSNPGISDIDMLVVFADDASVVADPVRDFPSDKYLFTHQIYGVSKKYWASLRRLTFFHNYKLIEGEAFDEAVVALTQEEERVLKRQIALEFLVKMHLVLTVQIKYNIVKLRSFLLEGKALIYDLEFLGIEHGEMFNLVKRIIDIRATWTDKRPTDKQLENIILQLQPALAQLLLDEFSKEPFFLPSEGSFQLAKNIQLVNGKFGSTSEGLVFSDFGLLNPRKYFNLLGRFNRFTISIPYVTPEKDSVVDQRFALLSELREYNSRHLPGFLIPASSLKVI